MYNHRDDLISDLKNLIPSGKGVEIGVFKGEFSKHILNNWEGTLYMVDVWRPLGDEYEDSSEKPEQEFSTGYEDYTLEEN